MDVANSDEGKGIIPLRVRRSDRARALPHSTAMYAMGALSCLNQARINRWQNSLLLLLGTLHDSIIVANTEWVYKLPVRTNVTQLTR